MKESKNLERLFQEKFKDFEVNPPSDSWNNIAARLNKKEKKKRVIPFWFKTSGIAASLAIVFFVFINKGNDTSLINNDSDNINENSISNVEANTKGNEFNNQLNPTSIKSEGLLDEKMLNNNSNVVLENKNSVNSKELDKNTYNTINSNSNRGVVSNKSQKKNNKPSINKREVFSNQSLVTNNKTQTKSNNKQLSVNENNSNSISKNQSLATNNKLQKKSNQKDNNQLFVNSLNSISENQNLVTNDKTQNKSNIESNEQLFVKQNANSKEDSQLVFNKKEGENNSLINKSKLKLLNSNKGINNEMVVSENSSSIEKTDSLLIENENIIANAVEDSILLASVETEENPLEKLLKEKLEGEDADEKEKEKRNKWAVSTNASPVYFNSTSSGSAIDEQFKDNSKSYENSLSFGLGLEYEMSNKFSLKSGVNTLAFNYSTNDVYYTTTLRSVNYNVKTIERNRNGENIILANKQAMSNSNDVENYVQNNTGSLSQNISYIEIPLELNYKLLDKKFGINLVGGMSTLFLNSNSVSLVSNGTEMEIGKANNLNNIHFSSNVGLGFKYAFWKSFQANFQPMFKYQINTFSNDSGNFKPYFIGLYSGISFSF
ncbi:hypothetical protein [Flavobacterium sp. N2270]|uniref:hypothetical protein n=1 Tax=Flavobacterium sp. N2270 TaxID=2986831 RepID=UPI0022257DBC|nr:hypothetical protein [Flavobacterium sp. N2270]